MVGPAAKVAERLIRLPWLGRSAMCMAGDSRGTSPDDLLACPGSAVSDCKRGSENDGSTPVAWLSRNGRPSTCRPPVRRSHQFQPEQREASSLPSQTGKSRLLACALRALPANLLRATCNKDTLRWRDPAEAIPYCNWGSGYRLERPGCCPIGRWHKWTGRARREAPRQSGSPSMIGSCWASYRAASGWE